ncbi:MAG TPA: nicotinate-nucleotide diphosphorylase (carboxylating), partial [Thermoanaerobaculia bacterium]|nr:nicotinate-nucleotide diphosphorylase (carboxylating) [Thermoanaerobaculia bacterium]
MSLDPREIEGIIVRALDEDLPDITSESIFSPDDRGSAFFLMRADGILCGLPFAEAVFRELDDTAAFRALRKEGDSVRRDEVVAEVDASVLALLSGERTALNLMQRASGIATLTRRYVEEVKGTKAKIYDTRKTAPGLRALDKYAVKTGGGENHRVGL